MKIFNKENGTKVVYVQLYDIALANTFAPSVPASFIEMATLAGMISKHNGDKFVRFDDEETVRFVDQADWIIDFKYYKDMRADELKEEYNKLREKTNHLIQEYNSELKAIAPDDAKRKLELDGKLSRIELLKDKLNQFPNLLSLKQGFITMPFPLVPDSDGFEIYCEKHAPYMAHQGLNPLQVLIFKKDGKSLGENEIIPEDFKAAAEDLLITTLLEVNEFVDNATPEIDFSEDHRYFVITYHIVPKEEVEEKPLNEGKEGPTFRLGSLFNRFKK